MTCTARTPSRDDASVHGQAAVDRRGSAGDEPAVVTRVEGDGPCHVLRRGQAAQCRLLRLAPLLFLIKGGHSDVRLGYRSRGYHVDGDPAWSQFLGDEARERANGRLRGPERD